VRVPQVVSNADIWPTVLDIVGLPELPGADGVSMLPLILEAAGADPGSPTEDLERPVFSHLARRWGHPKKKAEHIVSVTHGGMRLITPLADGEKSEFYDRAGDPTEQKNLFASRRSESDSLSRLIAEYEKSGDPPWGTAPDEVELDEMRLNHLRALGYVIKP
jgi:arylsulfatase A-like enzyme